MIEYDRYNTTWLAFSFYGTVLPKVLGRVGALTGKAMPSSPMLPGCSARCIARREPRYMLPPPPPPPVRIRSSS